MTITTSFPTIAILGGTGREGPALAMRWAAVGYPIIIGSRQEAKAQTTAAEINAKLGQVNVRGLENHAAAHLADVCVLTVVHSAHQAMIESLKSDLQGKILIDTTARVDFQNPVPPSPPSAARMAQTKLGDQTRVVAAFQNVPAALLKKQLGQSLGVDVLVCADDLPAAEETIKLAQAIGLRGYYAGNLDNAIVVEGLTSILISLNRHYGGHSASICITGIAASQS